MSSNDGAHDCSLTLTLRGTVVLAALAASVLGWLGCGTPGEQPAPAPGGFLSGTVRYDGVAAGPGRPLAVALYRSFPPRGPPVAAKLVESYEFPYRFQFSGLPPGSYYVGALIDVDRMDTRHAGMLVPTRDPHGYAGGGAPVALDDAHGAAQVDVVLEDVSK